MRITDLKTYMMCDGWRNLIFVRLFTDEGLTGLGEATTANRDEAVVAYLEGARHRHVIGSDPFQIEDLWARVYKGDFIRGGTIACAGLSAIDMACYDLMGKALGVPVWKLVGGLCRPRVRCYANGWYTVERTPEAIAERAREVVRRGYTAMKIDPFGAGAMELEPAERRRCLEIVAAVRDAVGPDVDLFIEGHGRFSPAEAKRLARELAPLDPGWFEEPCPWDDPIAWREVKAASPVPIAGGEHFQTRYGYRELIEARAVDILQPDIGYVGGFTEMRKVAAWADAYSMPIAPHNSQGPINTAASIHMAFAIPNLKIQEVFDDFMPPFVKAAVPGCLEVVGGYVAPPQAPGLGVELDEAIIAAHPRRALKFDLFAEGWERRFEGGARSG
jgi:galactonate dehydratase